MSSDATGTPDERARNRAIEKDLRDVRYLFLRITLHALGSLGFYLVLGEREREQDTGAQLKEHFSCRMQSANWDSDEKGSKRRSKSSKSIGSANADRHNSGRACTDGVSVVPHIERNIISYPPTHSFPRRLYPHVGYGVEMRATSACLNAPKGPPHSTPTKSKTMNTTS